MKFQPNVVVGRREVYNVTARIEKIFTGIGDQNSRRMQQGHKQNQ